MRTRPEIWPRARLREKKNKRVTPSGRYALETAAAAAACSFENENANGRFRLH